MKKDISKLNSLIWTVFILFIFTLGFSLTFDTIGLKNYARAFSEWDYINTEIDMGVGIGPPAIETKSTDVTSLLTKIRNGEITMDNLKEKAQELGSKLYYNTLGKALNTIAYDTATWLGSGGEGQKPLFIKEGWSEYLTNVADNAAGNFIETVGKQNGLLELNLCNPSGAAKISINMGLYNQYNGRDKPDCTFSEMKNNWEAELDRPDFLSRFKTMFNPESNDIGIALSLHSGILEEQAARTREGLFERQENDAWLDIRSVDKRLESFPGYPKNEAERIKKLNEDSFGKITGNILVDAANIFLNQLAITALDNLMRSIGRNVDTYTSPYNFYEPNAGPSRGGIAGAKERFRKIIEPIFNVRGDYNILNELSVCPDPNKAGPTNCVIDSRFQSAVEAKMTVVEAIEAGYLKEDGVFGFLAGSGLEPGYIEGYPYRSMKILRKFRIIPVGWELAAQYISENPGDINGVKTLGDLIACYNADDKYTGYMKTWCEGLVDPNWVLKSPLNYCQREGPGPEIVSEQVLGNGEDSYLAIKRNESYCADEQTCIQENKDGSCGYYGYCTEERRKWDFEGESCDPLYNTCQTYRSSDGNTISYLANTLSEDECGQDNAGCADYCVNYDHVTGNFNCINNASDITLRANSGIEACDYSSEGCHEFIRFKPGLGSNLLVNSSFEEYELGVDMDDGLIDDVPGVTIGGGDIIDDAYIGETALSLLVDTSFSNEFGPGDWIIGGQGYTFSFYAKNCSEGDIVTLSGSANDKSITLNSHPDWRFYSLSQNFPNDEFSRALNVVFNIDDSSTCDIDGLKLEMGAEATVWSDYRDNGLIYQKLAPDYLGCDGNSDPPECDRFVRECTFGELGCDLYTAQSDGMTIPARVVNDDYCPAECVGYDEYVQRSTSFDSETTKQFIPDTAQNCNAQTVGCDEFTNLDRIGEGAEVREYYSELKQCVVETATVPNPSCSDFYTWEGSSETGYQLRVFRVKVDGTGALMLTNNGTYDGMNCTSLAYDLEANPMCREFYDSTGKRFYDFLPYVITCSNDCHPYRRTVKNILPSMAEANAICLADCNGNSLCESECINTDDCDTDSDSRICEFNDGRAAYCKDGGLWRYDHQSCLYQAIPDEGIKCSADAAGCREYTGSSGHNVRRLFMDNFESGHIDDWSGLSATNIVPDSESLLVGGHSLHVVNDVTGIYKTVNLTVQKNKTYILKFIARSPVDQVITAYFASSTAKFEPATLFNGQADIDSEWQIFEFNSNIIEHDVSDEETLIISGTGEFYIDDIQLIEVTDRYYLITDSWQTPLSCYKDIFGNNQGPNFNLGCEIFTDREDKINYIHSFSNLCQDDAVGCELMVDTNNYREATTTYWFDDDNNDICDITESPDCFAIEADEYKYIVYNPDKLCNSADKGCQLLGDPYNYEDTVLYSSTYLKNDPNKYSNILCEEIYEGCASWTADDSPEYFKDPGDMICEWREEPDPSGDIDHWDWYRKKIKRCKEFNVELAVDNTGPFLRPNIGIDPICLSDADCLGADTCVVDENNYICETDKYKTIGYGGNGNVILQPTVEGVYDWAGLCPSDESGCSEYIDPVSQFNPNNVFNASFANLDGDANDGDGWSNFFGDARLDQRIDVQPYTLYRFGGKSTGDSSFTCDNNFEYLDPSNNIMHGGIASVDINLDAVYKSRLVYTDNNTSCVISVTNANALEERKIELREATVDYQLQQELDRGSCNGLVENDSGCVLFNERLYDGSNYSELKYDADHSIGSTTSGPPVISPLDVENDSNVIIKVKPNRICDKWLACKSFVQEGEETICYDVGLCDSLNRSGSCDSFVLEKKENQTFQPIGSYDGAYFANKSGYTLAGIPEINGSFETDYYPLGVMEQEGNMARVFNGNFEIYDDSAYPIGWLTVDQSSWDKNVFRVINNPYETKAEGIGYTPEGRSYLKLGSTHKAISEFIDVEQNVNYILSVFINTLNLYHGEARINVQGYSISGANITNFDVSDVSLSSGEDWTFRLGWFKIAEGISKIKLTLYVNSPGPVEGNFYFDDITLRPALNVRDVSQYAPQTCRLYPEDDSLSCEYYEESGIMNKGWYGYCLDYDRFPGSKDACLMWYPVDKVRGDEAYSGTGYSGRYPLYYCIETVGVCEGNVPKLYCSKFIRTVDASGQNKYWRGRVYEGSDFILTDEDPFFINWGENFGGRENIVLNYERDLAPFGSMNQPVSKNPYDWDSIDDTETVAGNDPIYLKRAESKKVRAGTPYVSNSQMCTKSFSYHSALNCIHTTKNVGVWDSCKCDINDPYYPYQGCSVSQIENGSWNFTYWDPGACDDGASSQINATCESDLELHTFDNIVKATDALKMIFAQSYGSWEWNGNNYVPLNGGEWGPPGTNGESDNGLCSGDGGEYSRTLFDVSVINISQGALTLNTLPIRTSESSVDFFNSRTQIFSDTTYSATADGYNNVTEFSFHPFFTETMTEANPSIIFVHHNSVNNRLSVGFFHNKPEGYTEECVYEGEEGHRVTVCTEDSDYTDNDGVSDFTFNNIEAGNSVVVTNDSSNPDTIGGAPAGSVLAIANGNTWHWAWSKHDIDGGMIEMPIGEWEMSISPSFNDINKWLFVYQENDSSIAFQDLNFGPGGNQLTIKNNIVEGDTGYCSVIPVVKRIEINSIDSDNLKLKSSNDIVNLTFNSIIDSQQLPLVMYAVDWGDDITAVSGVEMRSRPNVNNPHSLYHLYSYWELRSKWAVDQVDAGGNRIYCGSAGNEVCSYDNINTNGNNCADADTGEVCGAFACCMVQPKVKIKDNWGWCSCNTPDPVANCDATGENCTEVSNVNPGCQINNCNNDYNWIPYDNGNSYIVITE